MDSPRQTASTHAEELALENEARFRLDLDGANVGLFEWNIVTNESRWSGGFFRLHGLEPDVEPSYELWRSQVHPDDIGRVEQEIQRVVESGESYDGDYRILHPTGELRWTSLQATVKRNAAGRALLMSGHCGEITRRKLAQAALLESEKLALAGRLSAAISHEINNPLEAAYNLLYLARGMASQSEQADLLDGAVEQLRRVAEISQQTLRFSRPARPRTVRVAEVVESTLRLLGPKLSQANLQVRTELDESCEIWCSPGELQQVFANLLNNAAEASRLPRLAKVRVRSSVEWAPTRRRGVRVTVADSGPGMSLETMRRVREPFFTTKEGTGTGLGMWVVQELVAKLRGRLSIRTSTRPQRHGTTMSLFFPAGEAKQVH